MDLNQKMNGFESEDEFNDMGLMQALDIVSTTICAIYEIINKGYVFNTPHMDHIWLIWQMLSVQHYTLAYWMSHPI